MKNYIFLAVISMSILSCASFSHRMVKRVKDPIENSDISQLNGIYSLESPVSYDKKGFPEEPSSSYIRNHLSYFNIATELIDTASTYQLHVKNVSDDELSFTVYKDKDYIASSIIKVQARNDGMLKYNERNLSCYGIPYIFGGCANTRTRIGRTTDDDLLLNYSHRSDGALLLIFGTGVSYNGTYSFKKLKDLNNERI